MRGGRGMGLGLVKFDAGASPGRCARLLPPYRRPHRRSPRLDRRPHRPVQTRERPYVANIKSQIKRNATNEKRRQRNKAVKSELKTLVRGFREAVDGGDPETARTALAQASKRLDKAVSKGVIHKNQAANRKSAMAKRAAAL